jgi:hypothetical protein
MIFLFGVIVGVLLEYWYAHHRFNIWLKNRMDQEASER